ncbi:MAG: hypothetical protein HQK79_22955 [Desulfobacterales bacterium]|nr:hypothetical protein [Desulfobacterales bacterium]
MKITTCCKSRLLLPIDLFECMLTNSLCNLQAIIDENDKDSFLRYCKAPDSIKEKIFIDSLLGQENNPSSIGKYLCISCDDSNLFPIEKRYHYESELVNLLDEVDYDISARELKRILIKSNLNPALANMQICKSCCKMLIENLLLNNSLNINQFKKEEL